MLARRRAGYDVGVSPSPTSRTLQIETPEAVTVHYPLAGIGSRGLAAILDLLVLAGLLLAEAVGLGLVIYFGMRLFDAQFAFGFLTWGLAVLAVMLFVTYWGYYIFGEVARNGRTLGKRVMRLRVVREDGSRVGTTDSIVRNIVRIIDIMPGTYAVGIASMVFSRKAQRLGDMAAGTVVVIEPDVARFDPGVGDDRVELAIDYLRRRAELTPAARDQVGRALLATFGEEPAPGWDEPMVAGRLADLAGLR